MSCRTSGLFSKSTPFSKCAERVHVHVATAELPFLSYVWASSSSTSLLVGSYIAVYISTYVYMISFCVYTC